MRGELEAEQNCNILTPTLMAIIAFLSRSPGLLNWEPGGLASLGHVPHSSIFSQTATAQSGVLRAPSAGCWFSLLHLISNWLNFLCTELYNNLTPTLLPVSVTISHSIQHIHGQGYILIFLDRMHLLFTQVHFSSDNPARSEVNMLHLVFGMTQPGTEPRSPRPLANTLTIMPGSFKFFAEN